MELLSSQMKELDSLIKKYKNVPGGIMVVLQEVQKMYGYLSSEVQSYIAHGFGVAPEKVYGIVSFYTFFTTKPKGKFDVQLCMGTACFVLGNGTFQQMIEDKLGIKEGEITPDGKFSLTITRCLGCCGISPVIKVNDEVYGKLTEKKLDEIIKKYKDMEI